MTEVDNRAGLPRRAGLGLKAEHYATILDSRPDVGFFEIHAENYMGAGGPPHHYLSRIRERYPLSIHGVGLSIGGAGPLDKAHLARLRKIVDRYQPGLFSEHLAWCVGDGIYLNDLMPLPHDEEALAIVCRNIEQTQEAIGRQRHRESLSLTKGFIP